MPIRQRKYQIFSSIEAFDAIFSYKDTVVHKTFHGEFLFVRHNGKYYAYSSKCPHQGKGLEDCWIENKHVVCPFHQYHFSMESGRGHGLHLENFPIELRENGVYITKDKWSLF